MSEKSKNSPNRKFPKPLSVLIWSIVIVLGLLGLGIRFDFTVPAWEFESARAKWEAANISDYEMTILFYGMMYIGEFEMTIENHEVVSMVSIQPLGDGAETSINLDDATYPEFSFGSTRPANLHDYEISRLLEYTGKSILPATSPEIIFLCERRNQYEVSFNQQYGYVEEIILDSCPVQGLLCPTLADCEAGFRVMEFVVP